MGINPININVYWVLTRYPIRPNYNSSIISKNRPIVKYPKTSCLARKFYENVDTIFIIHY